MTLSNALNRIDAVSAGGATYPYTFKIFADSDLTVIVTDTAGVASTKVLTADYSVTGVGTDAGGNVVFVVAPTAGYTVSILASVPLTQTTDLVNETGFFQDRIETALDRTVRMAQVAKEIANRGLRLPEGEAGSDLLTVLPSLESRKGQSLGFDPNTGQPTLTAGGTVISAAMLPVVQAASTAAARAAMGPWGDAKATAAGGTQERTIANRYADQLSVLDFGANGTPAENKTTLQAAITYLGANGGGKLYISGSFNYGFETDNLATYPSFSGIAAPVCIEDHSPGNTYAGFPTAYDGAQVRYHYHTPQTTSPGNHDGNTLWLNGEWAPAYCLNNTAGLAAVGHPSRTASDNRRANWFIFNDGLCTWKFGQGTVSGAGYTDDELSNFQLTMYGAPVLGDWTSLIVEREYGCVLWNTGTNTPTAAHHLKAARAGVYAAIIEGTDDSTQVDLFLKHHNDDTKRAHIRNTDAGLEIRDPSVGGWMNFDRASRRAEFSGPVKLPSHSRTALPAASIGAMIYCTDATGGAAPAYSDGASWLSSKTHAAV